MQTTTTNANTVLKTVPVLLASLMTGMLLFAAIAGFLSTQNAPKAPANLNTLFIAAGGVSVLAMLGYLYFGNATASAAKRAAEHKQTEDQKRDAAAAILMQHTIIRAALWEGVGLFGAVITLISGNLLGLVFTAVAVVMVATLLPVRSRLDDLMRVVTGRAFGV